VCQFYKKHSGFFAAQPFAPFNGYGTYRKGFNGPNFPAYNVYGGHGYGFAGYGYGHGYGFAPYKQ